MPHRLTCVRLDKACQFGRRADIPWWPSLLLPRPVCGCVGYVWNQIRENLYVRFWTWGLAFLVNHYFWIRRKAHVEGRQGNRSLSKKSLLSEARRLKWAPCKWKPVPTPSWAKENFWLGLKKCQINSFSLLLSRPRLSLQSRSGLWAVLAGLSWTSRCDEIAVIPGFPQI